MIIGLGIGIPFIRNYVSSIVFDPGKLFTANTQGVWYDPSDINLTWRRNLLTYSEQFDNAVWVKPNATVTANAAVAPDGTSTADFLVPNTTATSHFVGQAVSASANSTLSFYAKAGAYTRAVVATNANNFIYFDLSTGVVESSLGTGWSSASIVSAGNGWYRCIATSSLACTNAYIYAYNAAQTNGNVAPSFVGDGTSGIYIWGAQLELGSTATPYQRITDGIQDYLQYQAQPVLYRDAAGTLPVTAVEQPVGLMLDKSKGLVLGPELVTNGDFSNGTTGWSAGGGALLSVVSGKLRITQPSSTGVWAYQALTTVVGRRYWVSLNFESISGSKFAVFVSTTIGGTETYLATPESVASYRFSFVATATTHYINVQPWTPAVGREAYFDNISVRELPGNHAFNSSGNSANFPVLSSRYNLLTKTELLTDAAWTKGSSSAITSGTETAPNGTATASLVTCPLSASSLYQGVSVTGSTQYRFSFYAKRGTMSDLKWSVYGTAGFVGEIVSPTTYYADVGSDWTLVTKTFTTNAASTSVNIYLIRDSIATGTVYLWGADLRVANDALNQPAYQRVNTATDYDTVGFKPYLRFNGTNQWLQTNSIDFSYGDKMFVSAGVRKLSDGSYGVVAEISTSYDSNSGVFSAGGGFNPDLVFASKGTISALASYNAAAPTTKVLSGVGNIFGDRATLRLNGTQVAEITTDQGTGNFGNYPLYIGARAGSSLWFNGRLYGMVVAGKLANAVEITETEKYVNSKTAAY